MCIHKIIALYNCISIYCTRSNITHTICAPDCTYILYSSNITHTIMHNHTHTHTQSVVIRQAGPNGFQGFLIQARADTDSFRMDSNIYGEWFEDSTLLYKPLNCNKNVNGGASRPVSFKYYKIAFIIQILCV